MILGVSNFLEVARLLDDVELVKLAHSFPNDGAQALEGPRSEVLDAQELSNLRATGIEELKFIPVHQSGQSLKRSLNSLLLKNAVIFENLIKKIDDLWHLVFAHPVLNSRAIVHVLDAFLLVAVHNLLLKDVHGLDNEADVGFLVLNVIWVACRKRH